MDGTLEFFYILTDCRMVLLIVERGVKSAEKQTELLSHVPSVEFAAECAGTSLHYFVLVSRCFG